MIFATASGFEALELVLGLSAIVYLVAEGPKIGRALRYWGRFRWPVCQATVEAVLAHPHPPVDDGSGIESFVAEISYSYTVDGEYYSGHHLFDLCSSQAEADALTTESPTGTIMKVRVHPSKPEVSVLDLRRSNGPVNATRKEMRAEEHRLQKIKRNRRKESTRG